MISDLDVFCRPMKLWRWMERWPTYWHIPDLQRTLLSSHWGAPLGPVESNLRSVLCLNSWMSLLHIRGQYVSGINLCDTPRGQSASVKLRSQTHMHVLLHAVHSWTFTYRSNIHTHMHKHKVKQLSWTHNQTVESCWGTLNEKECSTLS